MTRIILPAIAFCMLLVPRMVRADEPPRVPSGPFDAPGPLGHLSGAIGPFVAATPAGIGALVDVLGTVQIGPFALGGNLQLGVEFIGQNHVALAPVAGFYVPTKGRMEVGILATAGVHWYGNVGTSGLFSQDPGFNATLPFAGLRGIVGWQFDTGERRFTLGVHGFCNVDLRHETRTYGYEETDWLFGTGTPETITVTHSAGTIRTGAMFAFGGTFY